MESIKVACVDRSGTYMSIFDLFSLKSHSNDLTKLWNIYCRTHHNPSAVKFVQIYHSQMGVVVYCYLAFFGHGR